MIDELSKRLEEATAKYDEAKERVEKGLQWFKDNSPSHPKYDKAAKLLGQREEELKQAEKEFDAAAQAFRVAMAKAERRDHVQGEVLPEPSLNCQICGKPVHGYPKPKPGYWIHYDCEVGA